MLTDWAGGTPASFTGTSRGSSLSLPSLYRLAFPSAVLLFLASRARPPERRRWTAVFRPALNQPEAEVLLVVPSRCSEQSYRGGQGKRHGTRDGGCLGVAAGAAASSGAGRTARVGLPAHDAGAGIGSTGKRGRAVSRSNAASGIGAVPRVFTIPTPGSQSFVPVLPALATSESGSFYALSV